MHDSLYRGPITLLEPLVVLIGSHKLTVEGNLSEIEIFTKYFNFYSTEN